MTIGWTNGNGSKRAVFLKQASSGTALPVDDATYIANAAFGSGTQIGSSGWYCVYNGTGSSVTITSLALGTAYIAQVFEYNGDAGSEKYFNDTATDNPKSQTTAVEAMLGTGTSTTGTTDGCPINIYYRSLHGQVVYTKTELNAAGISGPIQITQIGFYVNSVPTYSLPNFIVRMKHTSSSDVSSWQSSTDMTTVYSTSSYTPTAGGYDMLTLSSPFTWDGTNNIVIDTAFSQVSSYTSTGTVRYYSVSNGFRYARSDSADQTNVFSGGSVISYKPQIKMSFSASDTTAPTIDSISSSKEDGYYKEGDVIDIDVNFSEAVSGNITVTLETGTVDRTCSFVVSDSTSGTCDYTVSSGDTSSDLNAAISATSGTIVDQSSNEMVNFTPSNSLSSNKQIVIDTTAPDLPVASPSGNTYTSVQSVSLSSSGSSAIYYTTDGSTPTTSSTLYSSAISISSNTALKAISLDLAGNESSVMTESYTINLDSTGPVISDVLSSPSDTSAVITWNTDEPSTSQIEYGFSSGIYASDSDLLSLVSIHSISLSDLKSCVRYYYCLTSEDTYGNYTVSDQYSFVTSGCAVSSISNGAESSINTSGGSLSLSNSSSTASITAPSGFYSESAVFQINKLNSASLPTAPTNTSLVSNNFYDLIAVATGSNTTVSSFTQPIIFTVSYGTDVESAYVESSLDVYKYSGGSWTRQNCSINTATNILTCSLNSFSVYAVFGQGITANSSSASDSSVVYSSGSAVEISYLQNQINDLIAKIKEAAEKLKAAGYEISASIKEIIGDSEETFPRDLTLGSRGEDVKLLQRFLNNNGFKLSDSGPGSLGNETELFGPLTQASLIKFQEEKGIFPSYGYFGPITRNLINSLF